MQDDKALCEELRAAKPHCNHHANAGLCHEATARLTALAEALNDLQQAEAEYRLMHDRHGDGSQAAGRAWDLMRRAGNKARAALATHGG